MDEIHPSGYGTWTCNSSLSLSLLHVGRDENLIVVSIHGKGTSIVRNLCLHLPSKESSSRRGMVYSSLSFLCDRGRSWIPSCMGVVRGLDLRTDAIFFQTSFSTTRHGSEAQSNGNEELFRSEEARCEGFFKQGCSCDGGDRSVSILRSVQDEGKQTSEAPGRCQE